MRSSKSRSRSKTNRMRTMGNIVNRVFDSSGPEGKVRGTPQQIIDKYAQLARDAQLGNDRVAAENFQQHAEHYTRMLGEALREQEARRDHHDAPRGDRPERGEAAPMGGEPAGDVIAFDDGARGDGLVDTPEEKRSRGEAPRSPEAHATQKRDGEKREGEKRGGEGRAPRKRDAEKPAAEARDAEGAGGPGPARRAPRKPRARKPAESDASVDAPAGGAPLEADTRAPAAE